VLGLIAAGSFFYAFSDTGSYGDSGGFKFGAFGIGLLFSILAVLSFGFTQIEPGHVGVVTSFGKVQEKTLEPGLHYVLPVLNQVTDLDARVKSLRVEGYTAASKEQQDLFMNMTLNYHIIPERASEIVERIGTDFENKIIMPRFLDIPKSITDDYATTVVLNSRDEIRERSIEALSESIEQYGFVVDNIAIENFAYSAEYNAEIEAKQRAEQQVQTERQILAQKEIQAQQAVVQARGEADARIEAARGEAEANRLLTESLNPELIQWTAIQNLQDNINIALVPSDGGLILDMGSALTPIDEPASSGE
jgi:regulator of protease activity HflC (stomatin/prohibitin superfamily)